MILEALGVSVRYERLASPALDAVGLGIAAGEMVAVVGPNGSGKTTLVRALLGLVPIAAGETRIKGRAVAEWRRPELARVVGVVSQREESLFPLRVAEAVMLGRYARLGPLAGEGEEDRRAVRAALERCDLRELEGRQVDSLSGGEWQRVRLARALAQEPEALVLDEPTASLDVRHEMELFELVRRLVHDGLACLVITHHLNLAARYADRLALLERGRLVALGAPAEVLKEDLVSRVFDWPVAVEPWRGVAPQIVPLRPGESA